MIAGNQNHSHFERDYSNNKMAIQPAVALSSALAMQIKIFDKIAFFTQPFMKLL